MESRGAQLKKIRLDKGISLEEVQKKTKIHINILKSIEGDSLTDLNPVYLKGFLKIYSKFLGLDPREYVPNYKETQATIDLPSPSKERSGKYSDVASPTPVLTDFSISLRSLRISPKITRAIFFIAIIIVIGIVLFQVGKSVSARRAARLTQEAVSDKKESKAPKNIKAAMAKPIKAQGLTQQQSSRTEEKAAKKEAVAAKKESSSGIKLWIRARENCWIYLKVDGHVVFQRVLGKGRSENWEGKDKMELSVGDAGAVELEANGQLFPKIGRMGQPRKNIVITKDGLNIGK